MSSVAADTSRPVSIGRQRNNMRPKVTLDDQEAARLRLAASNVGLKPTQFLRRVVLEALAASEGRKLSASLLPPTGADGATLKKKGAFTAAEAKLLKKAALAAGLNQQDFIRRATLAAITDAEPPKPRKTAAKGDLAHEIALLAFQLKKLGINVNQLAHQANTGLVPLTRAEIIYLNNQHQRLLTIISAAIEKVLA